MNSSKDEDEIRLEKLGKNLLAMPKKQRGSTKFAKKKAVKKTAKKPKP